MLDSNKTGSEPPINHPKKTWKQFGWDKGADYKKTYSKLTVLLKEYAEKEGIHADSGFAFSCVLLTQLRNGSRVSEAVEAMNGWLRNRNPSVEVRVRKQKTESTRLMVIPPEVQRYYSYKSRVLGALASVQLPAIEMWSRRRLGYNTHSLRYAWITEAARRGISPQLIAKITGHRTLDMVLSYTQKSGAEDILQKF
ncbi:MAG: hypothetical protein JRN02_07265 [Nitrososphaerota archaeon]|nr:hypothetical protein [Nitrososphaerota archaeon]MDG7045154.1 hypothetical protein [Nitrososphaerota archaeon]